MAKFVTKEPDFLVTINDRDVTADCQKLTIADLESQGHIDVTLDNRERKYTNKKIKLGDKLCIRFGYRGDLSEKVEMGIRKIHPRYGIHGFTVTVIGLDASHKLSDKTGRGHQEGTQVKKNLEGIGKEAGVDIDTSKIKDTGKKGGDSECFRFPMPGGTRCSDQVQQLLDQAEGEKKQDNSGGDTFADNGKGGGSGLTGNYESAPGLKPGDDAEKNRMNNASNRAKSSGIKASLTLVNYPILKAKKTLSVEGVDEYSGKWYVEGCTHTWSKNGAWMTHVDLMKGALGKGNGASEACCAQPMIYHANIYKQNSVYAGPRQSDGESQATFTFGDGGHVQSFDPKQDAQTGQGAGKQTQGKTVNPNKASDPVEEVKSDSGDKKEEGDQPPQIEYGTPPTSPNAGAI